MPVNEKCNITDLQISDILQNIPFSLQGIEAVVKTTTGECMPYPTLHKYANKGHFPIVKRGGKWFLTGSLQSLVESVYKAGTK